MQEDYFWSHKEPMKEIERTENITQTCNGNCVFGMNHRTNLDPNCPVHGSLVKSDPSEPMKEELPICKCPGKERTLYATGESDFWRCSNCKLIYVQPKEEPKTDSLFEQIENRIIDNWEGKYLHHGKATLEILDLIKSHLLEKIKYKFTVNAPVDERFDEEYIKTLRVGYNKAVEHIEEIINNL